MALKTFKPYTKSTRGTILVDRTGLWKGKPFKSLVSPIVGVGNVNAMRLIHFKQQKENNRKEPIKRRKRVPAHLSPENWIPNFSLS